MSLLCPAPEGAVPIGFLHALDRERMAALVRDHLAVDAEIVAAEPDYVRYKEQDGCVVGWRIALATKEGEQTSYVTARSAPMWRLRSESDRLQHRAGDVNYGLRTFALLPEAELLLLAFPCDRALPELKRLVRLSRARALVEEHAPGLLLPDLRVARRHSSVQLVRYKPGRRALLRWHLGLVDGQNRLVRPAGVFLRLYAEAWATRAAAAMGAARAGGVRCPAVLACPHAGVLLEEELPGTAWQTDLRPDTEKGARVLARLHGVPPPAGVPVHSAIDELDVVLQAAEDLGQLQAELGRMAAEVADRLAQSVPPAGEGRLLHGDFHRGQVLLDGEAGLIDFDRTALGAPAYDLASHTVHEILRDVRRGKAAAAELIEAYGRHRPLPAAGEQAFYLGAAFLRGALVPFRTLRSDWPQQARALLALAAAEATR